MKYVIASIIMILLLAPQILWASQKENSICDVQCKLKKHPVLSKIYRPDIPLILKSSNIHEFIPDYVYIIDHPYIKKALETLDAVSEKHVRPKFYKSCAVVGSSQNLRNSGYGPLIDQHDAIFRMNDAPIKNYTHDVGQKTTFRLFNSGIYNKDFQQLYDGTPLNKNVIKQMAIDILFNKKRSVGSEILQGSRSFKIYYQKNIILFLYHMGKVLYPDLDINKDKFQPHHDDLMALHDHSIFARMKAYFYNDYTALFNEKPLMSFPKYLHNQLKIIHPKLYTNIVIDWYQKLDSFPSTGITSIINALYQCRSVSIFGFGLTHDRKWGYYYKDDYSLVNPHNANRKDELIDMLEKNNIVTVYRGNKK